MKNIECRISDDKAMESTKHEIIPSELKCLKFRVPKVKKNE